MPRAACARSGQSSSLGEERDALGLPQPRLDLRVSEIDKRSIIRTVQIFAQELGKAGLGRAQMDFHDWPPQFYYGNHHMGTTRWAWMLSEEWWMPIAASTVLEIFMLPAAPFSRPRVPLTRR